MSFNSSDNNQSVGLSLEQRIRALRNELAQLEELSAICNRVRALEQQMHHCVVSTPRLRLKSDSLSAAVERETRKLKCLEISLSESRVDKVGRLEIQALEQKIKDARIRRWSFESSVLSMRNKIDLWEFDRKMADSELKKLYPILDAEVLKIGFDLNALEGEMRRRRTEIKDLEKVNRLRSRKLEESRLVGLDTLLHGTLFNDTQFYGRFNVDLNKARSSIEIVSPYVTRNRGLEVLKDLRTAVERGVAVRIYTKPLDELDPKLREGALHFVQEAESLGIQVFEKWKMHQKFALIDREICWEGSLNILSHRDSRETMRRLKGRRVAEHNRRTLSLDAFRRFNRFCGAVR